jgi:hypothetical protein
MLGTTDPVMQCHILDGLTPQPETLSSVQVAAAVCFIYATVLSISLVPDLRSLGVYGRIREGCDKTCCSIFRHVHIPVEHVGNSLFICMHITA